MVRVGQASGRESSFYALLGAMVKVVQIIGKHAVRILAHWDHGTTNAIMEGRMSVFSVVKRRPRLWQLTEPHSHALFRRWQAETRIVEIH